MSTAERIIAVPDTAEEAVSFGVAILDEHTPGWAEAVDVPTLRLASCGQCVLGQLFGNYEKGCQVLELYDGTAERCGFNVTGIDPWQPLQAEWERVITDRQEQAWH